MRRLSLTVAVLLMLAVPASASAQQYVLKHPKREHCRAHYVKKVETVRHRRESFCVHVASKPQSAPAAAPVPAAAPAAPAPSVPGTAFPGPSTPTLEPTAPYVDVTQLSGGYIAVSGGLIGSEHSLGYEQLTYTITDATRDVQLGSFTMSADADCAILETTEDTMHTFSGAADVPFAACGLSRVSLPASDNATIAASFAGSSYYASSTSESQAL